MRYLFFKILFKSIELLLILHTAIKYIFVRDKTKILLKFRDPKLEKLETERKCRVEVPLRNQNLLIVIPFKDKWYLTKQCLISLAKQKYESLNIHVVLVDNNSSEEATLIGLKEAAIQYQNKFANFKIEKNPIPFNFSTLNNQAVHNFSAAPIDILFFLNNDVEFVTENDLNNLITFFVNTENIGALGCTLVYPQNKQNNQIQTLEGSIIQHTFVAPGIKLVGAHPLKGFSLNMNNSWFLSPRIVPAVTGAALIMNYKDFVEVERFDEQLPEGYQDVDLSLKLQQANKINWTLTTTILIHHESVTRKKRTNKYEIEYMYNKWGNILTHNEFFSTKISQWSEKPTESLFEGNYPWRKVLQE